jgi:hypothetical protein
VLRCAADEVGRRDVDAATDDDGAGFVDGAGVVDGAVVVADGLAPVGPAEVAAPPDVHELRASTTRGRTKPEVRRTPFTLARVAEPPTVSHAG